MTSAKELNYCRLAFRKNSSKAYCVHRKAIRLSNSYFEDSSFFESHLAKYSFAKSRLIEANTTKEVVVALAQWYGMRVDRAGVGSNPAEKRISNAIEKLLNQP